MSSPSPFTSALPDVAHDAAVSARVLDWVGMDRLALPLRISSGEGVTTQVAASVDVAVDLADAQARGIHMSRLYLRVQDALSAETITPAGLRCVLQDCIDSQQGASTCARITLRYDHFVLRPALATDHAGWKNYPIAIDALLAKDHFTLCITFSIDYSSTCPASAALSRQLNADRFSIDFKTQSLTTQAADAWLRSERGMAATPHAQRSRAEIRVRLRPSFDELPIVGLIEAVEHALGTPVQTAVKRADEQAFAQRNAENLMFCEDAARRIAAVLTHDTRVEQYSARVAHFESLHAHDAVAHVSSGPISDWD